MTDRDAGGRADLGQVLPLVSLFMAALMLMAALAVDVTGVLSAERFYTTTAEAAALAGAQDLQQATSRQVGEPERTRSRANAMSVLVNRLEATSTPTSETCDTAGDVLDCPLPGTPYLVSIQTPSPTCVTCEPFRSVQVTIRNPSYGLTFAGLVGQSEWNVEADAVAGLQFVGKYAIQTLRPPHPLPNNTDQNRENISIDGTNTWVNVLRGDVGTNTSVYTNAGGQITLDSSNGYRIEHIDEIVPDPWNQVNGLPEGKLLLRLIPDPDYMTPDFDGLPDPAQGKPKAPTYDRQEDGRWDAKHGPDACPARGTEGFPPAEVVPGVPEYASYLDDPALEVTCYLPGVYMDPQGFVVNQNTEVAYLLPGAYYFGSKGISVSGTLLGGLVANEPGVTLVVPQDANFSGNNSVAIILNQGNEACDANDCRADPAVDWSGDEVISPDGMGLTIVIPRDPTNDICFDGVTPLDVVACTNGNNTLNLPGNGNLSISGVIYAPSDNIQFNGNNTSQIGEVGQIIAWTATYGGGAKLNQVYPEPEQVGTVRLDAACTASEVCN